jgi:hypothetical protein
MDTMKNKTKSMDTPDLVSGRRSFIWKAGAAMSAAVASTVVGIAGAKSNPEKGAHDRVGMLEDAEAIRRLHQKHASYIDRGMYEQAVDMFADHGEVVFNGGIFIGREKGIRRLYCERFRSGMTGRKIEPAPGFELDPDQQLERVEVAADRKSATGQFPYSIQVGTPMKEDSSLVAMARLQGGGIVQWWEGGICEISCVKTGETWKIRRLAYRASAKADYRPGRLYARQMDATECATCYPVDPMGPDQLA